MPIIAPVLRAIALLALPLILSACAAEDLTKSPPPIGDFDLGYTVVVAKDAKMVLPSRGAEPDEWEAALKTEIEKRVGRYDGEKLYHLGINVDAYALAIPGVPVVMKPKSILVISANVWDDSAQRRINAVPRQFSAFEGRSPETFIGSGITQTRETQITNLSASAARAIANWLVENKAWFSAEAAAARAAAPGPREAPPAPAN